MIVLSLLTHHAAAYHGRKSNEISAQIRRPNRWALRSHQFAMYCLALEVLD